VGGLRNFEAGPGFSGQAPQERQRKQELRAKVKAALKATAPQDV
jgi:hypothetical protein